MLWQKELSGADLVIRGARVLDPVEGIDARLEVRIDEGGGQDEPLRLDDAVPVRVHLLRDLGDRAAVDSHLEPRVDSLDGVEDTRAADHEIRAWELLLP